MNPTLKTTLKLTLSLSLALALLFALGIFVSLSPQAVPVAYAAGETCFATLDGTTVYSSTDAGAVRSAVVAANSGDTVKVAGTCAGVAAQGGSDQVVYINKNLTLTGGYTTTNWSASDPDAYPTTLDAESQGRVIVIPAGYNVTLQGLTITGGDAGLGTDSGSGIQVNSGSELQLIRSAVVSNTNTYKGSGLANTGTVTVTQSIIAYNTGVDGGGFLNNGKLTVVDTAIFNNQVNSDGGALQNLGQATFINSTLSGNTASANGGAIEHWGGTLWLTHTTIANNSGGSGDGIYVNQPMTATYTIFANGTDNCRYGSGVFNDGGYNIETADSCGLNATGSMTNTAPLLEALADNGGNTYTHALPDNSPALDAIPAGSCALTTDQRGFSRPYGAGCDIGAYEFLPDACFVEANGDNTTDYSSIDAGAVQSAINAANSGDTLKLAGTCAGVQQTAGIFQTAYINQNLTLRGGYTTTNWSTSDPDTYPTTLDAQSLGRVAVITETAGVTLENLTVTGGSASVAAGIYVDTAASLTLLNSQVVSNTATGTGFTDGSGGLGSLGQTAINGTTFSYNSAVASAGAVGNGPGGVMTVENSSFSFNSAHTAGALGNTGQVTITAGSFISNTANGAGAVGNLQAFGGTGLMLIQNSTFLTNTVAKNGGAVDNDGGEMRITGSTFTGNYAKGGGGIYNNSGSSGLTPTLYITNSTFTSNTAGSNGGGVVFNRTGQTTISGSTFTYNVSGQNGGAIRVNNGSALTITDSDIISNTAASGGGIYNSGDTQLAAVSVISNAAGSMGGGIYNDNVLTATNSLIQDNVANSMGGGIMNYIGTLTLVDSALQGNTSTTNSGGGLFSTDGSIVTVSDSLLAHNQAASDGGAMYLAAVAGSNSISNTLVSGNSATGSGGGIFTGQPLTMTNSTLSGNTAGTGGGLNTSGIEINLLHTTIASNTAATGAGVYNAATLQTASASILSGNLGGNDCDATGSDLQSGGYNLLGAGCAFGGGTDISTTSPGLAPLADNDGNVTPGGVVQSHALLDGSPALDAIPTGGSCPLVSTDQRGVTRPQGNACDIGAVEMGVSGGSVYLPIIVKNN